VAVMSYESAVQIGALETQLYLDTPGDAGERAAAALRTLLTNPARAPVLATRSLLTDSGALRAAASPPTRPPSVLPPYSRGNAFGM
jgi:hypothetical protein